ncbi:MAG: lytic transglycosylase [Balneola sp.]|jgi:membrane-bound lytic murein transglycosylase D|nr:lytic transglycosylase [Balneola sp.]MAO76809.1 lytic transglycosylase [Balneola sp.]MBF64966.1 lytic transglycosylase [Balneola sp.]HAW79551.1 lytic transglycosylase [Balneola sp.]
MHKIFTIIFCSVFFLCTATTLAQDSTIIKTEKMPLRLLPVPNPLEDKTIDQEPIKDPVVQELDSFQKDIIRRIADIYQLHVLSLESQLDEKPLDAETHINDAVNASQTLLDDYPELRSDRRFIELSRAVIAEYRQFYGISESANEAQGEIFAIQEELFADDDAYLNEDFDFPKDVMLTKTDVPLIQNRYVTNSLVYYTLKRPEVMELWLQRSEIYMPMIQRIFKEEKVPSELAYLAFIESGLNPKARSWAAAVGMWQFIAATGRVYGLEVNWWVDERRDPEKATRAAARHLNDLYDIWGDWHLAMANYNISPRGLNRAITRAGGKKDYWEAYPYLPRETRGYVPGFIATAMIGLNPEEFGFQRKYEGEPYSYDVVEVEGLMPLDALAEATGISVDELKDYNPELLRWATPPGNKYPLKIPTGKKEEFLVAYKEIPKENRAQDMTVHTVQRGESVGLIAQKYGTTVRGIYASNDNLSNVIHPGQKLVIPLPAGSAGKISANRPTNITNTSRSRSTSTRSSAPSNSTKLTYKVKTGDTIGHIAEWYDVRAFEIRAWNGIGNTIRVGQNLTVYVPSQNKAHYEKVNSMSYSQKQGLENKQRRGENILLASASSTSNGYKTYTVRKNDTLGEIAESFGVSVSSLRSLNGISGSTIVVGQVLKISKQ